MNTKFKIQNAPHNWSCAGHMTISAQNSNWSLEMVDIDIKTN